MASAGWHVQCAMHERILNAIDPEGAGRRRFLYIAQENEPPYALTVNEIGESALTIGRKQIDYASQYVAALLGERTPGRPTRCASSGPSSRAGRKRHGSIAKSTSTRLPRSPLRNSRISLILAT
jgi:hypothetical protein